MFPNMNFENMYIEMGNYFSMQFELCVWMTREEKYGGIQQLLRCKVSWSGLSHPGLHHKTRPCLEKT